MAIKDPLMFITIQEFKSWNGFNKLEFDEITTPDSEIFKAISIASNNINYLSGFEINKKWPEITPTDFTDEIQTATAYYVNFLLTKDVNYLRGQASISQGGITYSENNPDDPYFVVPEVFSCLRKIKHYLTFKGFPLNVSPRKSNIFFGNGGNENILQRYLEILDLETNDSRVKIKQTHPKNRNTVVIIDTNGIKSIDNLTTLELFTKYFSNDTMKLVEGKEGQEKKVISTIGGNSLWEVNKDNPNFIKPKDDKDISANDKRIIDVSTPTFLTDATNKVYVDNLLDKKQDKLIVGTNITIDENNKISATGGSADLSDYYKKEEINKKLEDKMDKDQFQYAFLANVIGSENPTLETTNKTVAGAINELKEKIKDKKFSNDYFKYNTETNEILLNDEENSLLCKDILENNEYKILKTQNKKLLQAINEILEKQPQPSPSSSNWKEVGTREKNKWDYWQITYDFQENKHYRVYYSWSIYNPVYTIQEFIITDKKIAGVPIQTFNDSANIVILSVQHAKWITIYTGKGNLKGNLWKLEELQE
ncbi:hypothetical protein [Spiroplasma ixodetis]|uniref:hypothetical protein n=1 Tax=Spiroplasma ixodetis TaxID=2141 RepID=UPI002578B8FC|nr:hypothetical protein [Spiroplasma ixodetis]WJG71176.1 hypothetical protein SIXOD_v1c25370 [Spiroplasma ixodetis Y32]